MPSFRDKNPHILVIGDLMIDHYLWGGCDRISPEAPVQVVDISRESRVLGGAGNVINNLITLGAKVDVLSVIGDDDNGQELRGMFKEIDVSSNMLIVQPNRKSSKKSRIIASSQQILRYDKESRDDIEERSVELMLEAFKKNISKYEIVIISDYAKGVITTSLAQAVMSEAKKHSVKVLVDPKGSDYSKYSGAYLLTPNKKEASQATAIDINDEKSLQDALLKLKSSCNLELSLITLSEDGIAVYDEKLKRFPTVAKEVFDVTGAGDTVIASLAYALALNFNIDEASRFSNLAAGVVVGKIGSATVSIDEIEEYEASLHQSSSDMHIKSVTQIEDIVQRCRLGGKKIVFTNGCFDILHVGHVKYLQEAKSYGDVLIVGLNSDASVKRLKGESRPINHEDDRAYLLAALEAVDYVVKFGEDTPYELIKMIEPDTLVKGGDYEGKSVVGSEFSKELKLVTFVDGKSTTSTIQRIQKSC
ncbi:MAG: D-glycero-beta-D-manno-heptose-7-phosphate kinase [Campylobacterota bacterium]|nr:D-glycero-beta-D-manno-heptose-7-phosphate kinase [Campylobacterota bacterium]